MGGSLAVNLSKVRLEGHLAKYDAEIAAQRRRNGRREALREADAAVKFAASPGIESL